MAKTLGDITSELTEKILSPAKAEAEKIVSDAKAEARRITTGAETEAEKIRQTAGKEAEDTRKQMETDLDTAARNFVIMVQDTTTQLLEEYL